jgi:antitoxin (DNA-binding transcriptional repressor) of toxin-antitoxin stability system
MQLNVYEAKTQFSSCLAQAEAGQEVIIARGGKPVARLTAIKTAKREIHFGLLKNKIRIADDFDAPLPDEVLAGFGCS